MKSTEIIFVLSQFNMPLVIFEIIISNLKSLSKVACLWLIHGLLSDTDLNAVCESGHRRGSQSPHLDRSQLWIQPFPVILLQVLFTFLNAVPHQTMFLEPSKENLCMHAAFFQILFHKNKGSTNLNILLHFPPSEWELSSFSCRTNTDHRVDLKTAILLFTLWLQKCHRACYCC